MISFSPLDISTIELQNYLQSAIAPRPIAFASTIDINGNPNLSPFSFFNIFSANPPILVFSPARRMRDNTTKHTLHNCQNTHEVVINVVNYDLVQQMSLSSTEYPEGVNEFEKSGLTPIKSLLVKPFRVAESPVQLECKVNQIIPLGTEGGAGNLIICEIVQIHISEKVLDENGKINQRKMDLVARLGNNWYCRANDGLFEVQKPLATIGIGVDAIPDFIKESSIFDGNDLGKLGNTENLPTLEEINIFVARNNDVQELLTSKDRINIFKKAKQYLTNNDALSAWKMLLANL